MKPIRVAPIAPLLLSSAAWAQTAPPPSITAHATAQITAPLQIQCSAMHFSSLLSKSTATSLTLPPDGSPILDPNGILLPGAAQDAKASSCSVSGDVGATYNVSVPSSVNLTNGSGQSMAVNTFTVSSDGDSNPLSRLLHNDGTGVGIDSFGVGAKLNVGANQPAGTYSGTYVVSVQYN
jgi:hypothetical protein